jgi:putative exporter of polyketide antibiotics
MVATPLHKLEVLLLLLSLYGFLLILEAEWVVIYLAFLFFGLIPKTLRRWGSCNYFLVYLHLGVLAIFTVNLINQFGFQVIPNLS